MPSSPSHNHKHKSSHKDKHNRSRYQTAHYGAHRQLHRDQQRKSSYSLLLDLPTESLTHVTAFLDPPSLFSLAQTCKSLYRHVGDDNTWRRAFFYQFLGVHPESTLDPQESARDGTMLMLRREEVNWKREFVARWNLRRRWERTRSSSTISHVPVHSSVSDIYLLAPDTRAAPVLLTASLTYGVVARSQPLTGKISKGYLDASGTLNGFGHGNPNAEFSPHLSQCVITSPGGSAAKLLWAFRTGVVAVTTTPKATDFSRPCQAQYKRCRSEDAHAGTIEHAVWIHVDGSSSRFFATAGSDGRVKVWDADNLQKRPWSSPLEKKEGATVTVRDGCIRVAADGNTGTVAALRQSGEMTIWSGLKPIFSNESDNSNDSERTFHLPVSPVFLQPLHSDTDPRGVLSFSVHTEGSGHVSVITTYTQSAFFTKITVNLTSEDAPTTTILGQESLGQIASIQVALPDRHHPSEKAFVVVGDVFGYTSIFDLNASPTALADSIPPLPWQSAVVPFRRFAAFDGSAVTALLWTPAVLIVGSAHGVLKAFDATTFDLLREFKLSFVRTMTEKDAVTRIQVVRDLVVAAVDDRVYAWRGEPMGNLKPGRGKMRAVKMPNGLAKWHHQAEMYKDIAESQRTYEHESARTRRAFGREKEQNTTLESLGLSEVEAVEYVLMLSRDEEERKRREAEANVGVVAGTFDEDLDDVHTPVVTPAAFIEGSSSSQSRGNGRYVSRTPPSYVHAVHASRVQVSPRIRPEPMEAGSSTSFPTSQDFIARSVSSSSSLVGSGSASGVSLEDESQFPTMSTGGGSIAGSPQSSRSGGAWSTPLMMTRSENGVGGSGSVASSTSYSDISRSFGSSVQGLDGRFAGMNVNGGGRADCGGGGSGAYEPGHDEDEDLRFAIELSLAEARSRGETV